ncbi:MAG: porin family protein [Halomonadaceae bacterium]|nr:MAG: porin family protein [Halomonadaceae bacterium]
MTPQTTPQMPGTTPPMIWKTAMKTPLKNNLQSLFATARKDISMKKLITVTMIAWGLWMIPLTATAQSASDPSVQGYIGGGLGYYRLNDDDFLDEDDRLKDNQSAFRVFAGAEFSRVFSLQADYIDFRKTSDGNATMEADGFAISGMAAIPLTPFFAPYAKVGQLFWDRKRSLGPISSSDDGNDMFYGVGTRFTLASNVDLRLEYERFTLDNTDLDMASASIQLRF